jgi:hypothetical protein
MVCSDDGAVGVLAERATVLFIDPSPWNPMLLTKMYIFGRYMADACMYGMRCTGV